MATFSAKSHLPLVPFLQPVWGVREYIYETVVDTLDDPCLLYTSDAADE